MPTDWELLALYAAKKDQSAFTELVTRHLNLVYNSARRMLGNPGREAEDITQAVFLLLSQKAHSIPHRTPLAAWLHRATRYCCANLKTEERRRRHRERTAAQNRPESLFKRQVADLRSFMLEQDVIYVGGGNTANLLAIWRAHGLDKILREARHQNIVFCGISAGSICWFEAGVTDSFGPTLAALHGGLGFLTGSNCPHYDGEAQRRPAYHRLVKEGRLPAGYAADDGCALHFDGDRLVRIVSSRQNARAYRVESRDGEVIETPLDSDFLG